LAAIYVRRGLTPELAEQVATQLAAHDALGAHARDELGITEMLRARPLQAALASAAAFAVGAALPIGVVLAVPEAGAGAWVTGISLACLAALGGVAAQVGGAVVWRGAARVVVWSALAMAFTAGVGHVFGVATAG
jgi:VIT1/CCC1 family predicted Fe2+/Mn2+ transporter